MSKASLTITNAALYDVVQYPIVTEKTTIGAEQNKFTFQVMPYATKESVKGAVEKIFSVKVKKVNIINVKGKVKRFRGVQGKRSDSKKAIVSLEAGQTIDLTSGV